MNEQRTDFPRLTALSHGGGCGCKIAPGVLEQILAKSASPLVPPQLLVGIESSDDAAVYQLNDEQAVVATTDFFMPIVDEPRDFGRIAAANALSDVYAMGGTPLFALALVGMPVKTLPMAVIRRILEGGESICAEAGIPVAGGHTIDSVEPIYGLVAIGVLHPSRLKRNSGARSGDVLILGKGLGVGLYGAAFKKNALTATDYATLIASTTQLNTPGAAFGALPEVHAMTDVTGFGLLGHLLEICKGSGVMAILDYAALPVLPNALDYAARGFVTGASARNWESCERNVRLDPQRFGKTGHALLTDPQTSGGLLVACAPEAADDVLAIFQRQGFGRAAAIGRVAAGEPRIEFSD